MVKETLIRKVQSISVKDVKTGTGYFLPECSDKAQSWGVVGETATITDSKNPDHLKEDDPNYLPPNSVAAGVQLTVTFDGTFSSQSFSGGIAVGSGQAGVFVSSSTGIGLKHQVCLRVYLFFKQVHLVTQI